MPSSTDQPNPDELRSEYNRLHNLILNNKIVELDQLKNLQKQYTQLEELDQSLYSRSKLPSVSGLFIIYKALEKAQQDLLILEVSQYEEYEEIEQGTPENSPSKQIASPNTPIDNTPKSFYVSPSSTENENLTTPFDQLHAPGNQSPVSDDSVQRNLASEFSKQADDLSLLSSTITPFFQTSIPMRKPGSFSPQRSSFFTSASKKISFEGLNSPSIKNKIPFILGAGITIGITGAILCGIGGASFSGALGIATIACLATSAAIILFAFILMRSYPSCLTKQAQISASEHPTDLVFKI